MKAVITVGNFDVIDKKKYNLLHQMRKQVIPSGAVIVLLLDDYEVFKSSGHFPIQTYITRRNNLSYFADQIFVVSDTVGKTLSELLNNTLNEFEKITYVTYDDNKDFPWRGILKERGIPIKFIKWKDQK